LVASDGREIVEKFVDRVTAFQVIDEIPERDARTTEYCGSAENVRIAVNDGGGA
jgi:hypothetical protein